MSRTGDSRGGADLHLHGRADRLGADQRRCCSKDGAAGRAQGAGRLEVRDRGRRHLDNIGGHQFGTLPANWLSPRQFADPFGTGRRYRLPTRDAAARPGVFSG